MKTFSNTFYLGFLLGYEIKKYLLKKNLYILYMPFIYFDIKSFQRYKTCILKIYKLKCTDKSAFLHFLWKWPIICCSYNQIHLSWPYWEKYSIISSTIALSAFTDLFGFLKLVFGHYSCFQKNKNENKLLMVLKYFEHFNSEYQSIIFLLTRIKIYYIM